MIGGLDGNRMLLGLAIGIIVLIFLVLKTKSTGVPCPDRMYGHRGRCGRHAPLQHHAGRRHDPWYCQLHHRRFRKHTGSIGIIIGFGVMMGQIFEVTGAAKRMALHIPEAVRKEEGGGSPVSDRFPCVIPIFCDSGFVVLSPHRESHLQSDEKSVIGLGVALAAGLVITHSLVPPTPGPLGVCGIFGIDVGTFILMTLVLSIPMAIGCVIYAKKVLPKKVLPHPQRGRRDRGSSL